MKTAAGPETLAVNGAPLRQAREARGLSIPEMATLVTLSREQVRALEDGGNLPFYTAAHKLLVLRKYANALAVPVESLITDTTVPSDAPAAPSSAAPAEPATADGALRLEAVERTAQLRRQILMTLIAGAILLAIYAKWRGTDDGSTEVAQTTAEAVATEAPEPETDPVAVPPAAVTATAPTTVPEPAAPGSAAPATAEPVAAAAAVSSLSEGVDCAITPPADPASWTPAYQRKQDIRLFIISRSAAELCVIDAAGKTVRLSLKPSAGQSFLGKPPYLVYSERLSSMEIYLQGMRARLPADARWLRLVPTRTPAPAATSDNANGN